MPRQMRSAERCGVVGLNPSRQPAATGEGFAAVTEHPSFDKALLRVVATRNDVEIHARIPATQLRPGLREISALRK